MIEVKNLSFCYEKNKKVLEDINLKIEENESVGIIGANGAGKSTLLKLLLGLELDYNGDIYINNLRVEKKNLEKIRQGIGYVFQESDSQLFMPTIYQDIAFAPKNHGFSDEEVNKRTMEALEKVGIADIKDRPTYRLSGGQKKLASIATVLSMEPDILVFDEPTIALDPKNRRRFINIINSLDGTKVIASHDLDLIYDTCTKTILISDGKVIQSGETKEILHQKDLLENNGLELPLSLIGRKELKNS